MGAMLVAGVSAFATILTQTPASPSTGTAVRLQTNGVRHEQVVHEGATFEVVWVDPARAEIGLYWKDASGRPYRTTAALENALAASGRRVLAVMNAGIFDSARQARATQADSFPLGLHVENGTVIQPLNLRKVKQGEPGWGNFYILPNAVFLIDRSGRAAIIESSQVAGKEGSITAATQSGPALVLAGQYTHYKRPGGSDFVRNAVGVCEHGQVALVYTRAATLHELSSLFRERLGCPNAVYLDGNISALSLPGESFREEHGRYVGLIAVIARP